MVTLCDESIESDDRKLRSVTSKNIWHTPNKPQNLEDDSILEVIENGLVVWDQAGIIKFAGSINDAPEKYARIVPEAQVDLLVPGFIDTHVHIPQLAIIGCYGKGLLDWLQNFTFPWELRFSEEAFAEKCGRDFFTQTLKNGITSSVAFSTNHEAATDKFFQAAKDMGTRLIAGKASMDRLGPAGLLQTVKEDRLAVERLIEKWHGYEDRLFYALTPRFSPACSEELLTSIGQVFASDQSLYIQSHIGETKEELELVKTLFPKDPNYLATYERFGLVSSRTILAHCIYMESQEILRMSEANVKVAHCPTSNLFLGSGLFPWEKHLEASLDISLATDVGGGTTFSIWQTMNEAYKVQTMRGQRISPAVLFHSATAGGASAIGMSDKIGDLSPGKSCDIQLYNFSSEGWLAQRFRETKDPLQKLFGMITMSGESALEKVYIVGNDLFVDKYQ